MERSSPAVIEHYHAAFRSFEITHKFLQPIAPSTIQKPAQTSLELEYANKIKNWSFSFFLL